MMIGQQAYRDMTESQLSQAYVDGMNGNGRNWKQAQAAIAELQRRKSPNAA